ncbi:MAG: ABC transporter substrate-binding protein [Clostridia bacterium]|nr:ABC transporter substrate-binding protein [Clostridia bacterium]
MKKVLSILLALMMVLLCFGCDSAAQNDDPKLPLGGSDKDTFTVGICQLTTHVALDAATKGFKDVLTEEFGDKVTFIEGDGAGETSTCSTIVNDFVSKNVDLIMANATGALQAAANATLDIPILGTSVTEYGVALEIENFSGTVGGNISGTSDLAPLTEQAQMIVDLCPNAKKVGLLYCSAEANSEYQVKVIEDELGKKNIETKRFSFADSNDVAQVTEAAADWSDAIYVPTDNKAADCTATINSVTLPKKVPIIAGEEGICSGCGIATLSISYENLGRKTGEMAVKILKGESDISEMPIEYDTNPVKKYNKSICTELGITPPEGYVAIE